MFVFLFDQFLAFEIPLNDVLGWRLCRSPSPPHNCNQPLHGVFPLCQFYRDVHIPLLSCRRLSQVDLVLSTKVFQQLDRHGLVTVECKQRWAWCLSKALAASRIPHAKPLWMRALFSSPCGAVFSILPAAMPSWPRQRVTGGAES